MSSSPSSTFSNSAIYHVLYLTCFLTSMFHSVSHFFSYNSYWRPSVLSSTFSNHYHATCISVSHQNHRCPHVHFLTTWISKFTSFTGSTTSVWRWSSPTAVSTLLSTEPRIVSSRTASDVCYFISLEIRTRFSHSRATEAARSCRTRLINISETPGSPGSPKLKWPTDFLFSRTQTHI